MEGSYISKGQWEIDEQRIQAESFQINLVCQKRKENLVVKWKKKSFDFRYTQWQLYKLNGGISSKIKLCDYTRK